MILGAMINLWRQKNLRNRLLFLVTVIFARTGHCSKSASLFESSQHVKELNPVSFHEIVEAKVPWVIDCYSPGCPHCIHFKPTVSRVEIGCARGFFSSHVRAHMLATISGCRYLLDPGAGRRAARLRDTNPTAVWFTGDVRGVETLVVLYDYPAQMLVQQYVVHIKLKGRVMLDEV